MDILPQENDNVPVAEEMPAAIQAAVPEDVKEVIKNMEQYFKPVWKVWTDYA